jgi:valyl-tRNA synthetase
MPFEPEIKEKRWDVEFERKIFSQWEKEKIFSFNIKTRKKIFSIDTPPPYPSGRPWHIGAAAHYSQIDMIARTARMLGFEVFFPIGIDRNGVPVEKYVEKKFGIKMHETPREKFIELAKTALDDLEAEMIEIMKKMGLSGDFENYYRTDSEEYRRLTQETFLMLWEKNLIYQATRPNNYCPDCKTTLADADYNL